MQRKGELTRDKTIATAKAGETVPCGGGLVAKVAKTVNKTFLLRYRFGGKAFLYTIGQYGKAEGQISLEQARLERNRLKLQIKDGINPSLEKKKDKLAVKAKLDNGVEDITRAWFKTQEGKRSDSTNRKNMSRFERHLFPAIGYMPIEDIEPSHLYSVFDKIRDKPETCQKLKEDLRRVFAHALLHKKIDRNPVNDVELREIVIKKEEKNMPFLFEEDLPQFFKELYDKNSVSMGLYAFHFACLTFLRPINIRKMKWEYIDLENSQIVMPEEEMKVTKPHIVPISKQLRHVIEQIKELGFGYKYVFPSTGKNRFISEHVMMKIIHKAGYKDRMSMHGWRHCFSTIANNSMEFHPDAIEIQLHHSTKSTNKIRATYNKAEYIEERIRLMQWWADKLESLGAKFNFDIDSGRVS